MAVAAVVRSLAPEPRRPGGAARRGAGRQPVIQGAAHQLVGESVSSARRDGASSIIPCAIAWPRAVCSSASAKPEGAMAASSNSYPTTAASSSSAAGGRLEASQTLADDLPHALRTAELGQRVSQLPARSGYRHRFSVADRAPELGHQECVAAGELMAGPVQPRSSRPRDPAAPALATNSETSSALRPPRRSRTTPSARRSSTSAAESASGISASVSRNVVTIRAGASIPLCARWRNSSSVGVSAQWASSITITSGARFPAATSRSATAL